MNRRILFLALAGALSTAALAQEGPLLLAERHVFVDGHDVLAEAATAKATAEAWRDWADELRTSFGSLYGQRFSPGKAVKGAPYSADVVTESNQPLADGNVISKKTGGRAYRDGEGRTRQETVVNGEAKSIQISDPVEGKSVMLLPGSKRAVTMPRFDFTNQHREVKVVRAGDKEIRIDNGKVTVDGKDAPGKVEITANGKEIRVENGKVWVNGKEVGTGPGAAGVAFRHKEETVADDGTRREEVRIHVVKGGEGKEISIGLPPMPPMPPMPPLAAAGWSGANFEGALGRSKGTTTSLGSKEFDGVRAEGTSTVRTIAAGEIGNRNPILLTSETWYSPELQVTVYSRQSDPRYGESVYRLTGIRRAEPAAELFKIPEDYKGGKRARG